MSETGTNAQKRAREVRCEPASLWGKPVSLKVGDVLLLREWVWTQWVAGERVPAHYTGVEVEAVATRVPPRGGGDTE